MKKHFIHLILFLGISPLLLAQDNGLVFQTFKSTRIINAHSTEMLPARKLDFRIAHRFGDIAGDFGGWENFFGFEQVEDVLIGFDYGLTNNLTIGLSRSKGAGPFKQLVHGLAKYRILHQTLDDRIPLSLTVAGTTSISTMKKSDDPSSYNGFVDAAHRVNYFAEMQLARKFSPAVSLQVQGGIVHRNIVPQEFDNTIGHFGIAGRFQLSKVFSAILDANIPIDQPRADLFGYGNIASIGFGLEIETGGHVFQLNLTNSGGIEPLDYLSFTDANWGDGRFRFGFTISRLFNIR